MKNLCMSWAWEMVLLKATLVCVLVLLHDKPQEEFSSVDFIHASVVHHLRNLSGFHLLESSKQNRE